MALISAGRGRGCEQPCRQTIQVSASMGVQQLWPHSWKKVRPKCASLAHLYLSPVQGQSCGASWPDPGVPGLLATGAWGGCSCEGLRVMLGSEELRLERNQRAMLKARVR